jgi:putative ATP-grasp target RiPP
MDHSATAVRPFGLRFARRPRGHVALDLESVGYDEERQVGIAVEGDRWVPLARHSMAVTLHSSGETPREDEIYDKA